MITRFKSQMAARPKSQSVHRSPSQKAPAKKAKSKKAKAKKATSKASGTKKVTRKRVTTSFAKYIHVIVKNKNLSITKKTMDVLDSFNHDVLNKISAEAQNVAVSTKHKLVSARDVEYATQLVLPKKYADHAHTHAARAVNAYKATVPHRPKSSTKTSYASSKKRTPPRRGPHSKKPVSTSKKAGIKFPVARTARLMKRLGLHVTTNAAVYLAAVLESITEKVVDKMKAEIENKPVSLKCRHLKLAVGKSKDLQHLFADTTIPEAGVTPSTKEELKTKKSTKRTKNSKATKKKSKSTKKKAATSTAYFSSNPDNYFSSWF